MAIIPVLANFSTKYKSVIYSFCLFLYELCLQKLNSCGEVHFAGSINILKKLPSPLSLIVIKLNQKDSKNVGFEEGYFFIQQKKIHRICHEKSFAKAKLRHRN